MALVLWLPFADYMESEAKKRVMGGPRELRERERGEEPHHVQPLSKEIVALSVTYTTHLSLAQADNTRPTLSYHSL